MEKSFLLSADSYKTTHWPQYPANTSKVLSYLESRGGKFDHTLFFGLQYILKEHFIGQQVTMQKIDAAEKFWQQHFGMDLFNRKGWEHIVKNHSGKLPLKIRAIKEGTLVSVNNVLMTIENTDPECYWLTNFAETLLLNIWYPITIATNSFYCKRLIKQSLEKTGNIEGLPFKLHDFGMRGVSGYEQGGIGGMSHLVNFMGTDTVSGILFANKYYNSGVCGFSIPASEHSTITSWGKENEAKAYENILEKYPSGLVACVSDSYDIYNACDNLWGKELKAKVMARNGTLVIRPDSGNPPEVISKILGILSNKFGGSYNNKGFFHSLYFFS